MSGPDGFWTPGEGAEELDKQIAAHNKKQLEKAMAKKLAEQHQKQIEVVIEKERDRMKKAAAERLFHPHLVVPKNVTVTKTYKSWMHGDWAADSNHPESADMINAEIEAAGSLPVEDDTHLPQYAPVIPLLKQALGLNPADHYTMDELIEVISIRHSDFIQDGFKPDSARCRAVFKLYEYAVGARIGSKPIGYTLGAITYLIEQKGQWLLPLAAEPGKAPKQQPAPPAVNVKAAPVTGKRKIVLED